MKCVTAFIVISLFELNSCLLTLYRGRLHTGNLQKPKPAVSYELCSFIFEQKLDHFGINNTKTWLQQFYVNNKHYKEGGPAIMLLGDTQEAHADWLRGGVMLNYAKKFSAMTFMLEHRFYGNSIPTGNLTVESLHHLKTEQVLADIANFIYAQKKILPPGTKWIVYGGSYAGSLAAWMRLKYPHLVYASVASSGPLRAKIDFSEYLDEVIDVISLYDYDCVDTMKSDIALFKKYLDDPNEHDKIQKHFNMCQPLSQNKPEDNKLFLKMLVSKFAELVQFSVIDLFDDYRNKTASRLQMYCHLSMKKEKQDRVEVVRSLFAEENCFNTNYSDFISMMRSTSNSSEASKGMRQWAYQTCHEYGFFQTTASDRSRSIFTDIFPLEDFVQECTDIFGSFSMESLKTEARKINRVYGGLNNKARRILYVYGATDPWRKLGITKSYGRDSPVILMEGVSHGGDLSSLLKNYSNLRQYRDEVRFKIKTWINQRQE